MKNPYTAEAQVDWRRLGEVVRNATHFLDNVIDENKYPVPELEEKALRDRRIGLGVMGWAEMLVQLMLPYDSSDACFMATAAMRFIKKKSLAESMRLAHERGTYPEWEGSQWHQAGLPVRNATLTTVAPTGTISMIAAQSRHRAHLVTIESGGIPEVRALGMPCSGGIEPKFALVFTRNQAGMIMLDIDQQFEYVARKEGWYSEELMKQVAERGSCKGVPGVPEHWQRIFVVANEISPDAHVHMQAAFQGPNTTDVITQPIDSACSKTINFAHKATIEDVDRAYRMAWGLGLKGITVYRDGSRFGQVLSVGVKTEERKPAEQVAPAPEEPELEANDEDNVAAAGCKT